MLFYEITQNPQGCGKHGEREMGKAAVICALGSGSQPGAGTGSSW